MKNKKKNLAELKKDWDDALAEDYKWQEVLWLIQAKMSEVGERVSLTYNRYKKAGGE